MYDRRQLLIIGAIAATFLIANGAHVLADTQNTHDVMAAAIGGLIGATVAGIVIYEIARRVPTIVTLTRAQLDPRR